MAINNLTLKIRRQGHGWGQSSKSQCESNILSTHIHLVQCQSVLPSMRYSIFKIWHWKSKVKVKAQDDKVGITPCWLISLLFHVDGPSHSWYTAISKFDIENSQSRSWVRSKLKDTTWVQHSVDSHPFRSMSIGHHILELRKSRVKIKWSWCCTTTCLDQSMELRMVSSPSAAWFDKFWPMDKHTWGKWANNYDVTQLQV